MEYLKKKYIKDTFVVSNLPYKKFHMSSLLLVGNAKKDGFTKVLRSIIKFKLDNIDSTSVISAYLNLYIRSKQTCNACKFPMKVNIGLNTSYVYVTSTCWDNAPSYKESDCFTTINSKDIGSYIRIDITDIINKWLSRECNNNGLTIYGDKALECGIINFSSTEGSKPPFLEYTLQ
ncbi:MAG: DNRLRE domain-containing protein [Clostridium sp.]